MSKRQVWVIEIDDEGWDICSGNSFFPTRKQGLEMLRSRKTDNPNDKFRLTKYVPEVEK